MRRISAENLNKSPADPPMARATVLFQNQDRHSLCLLRPGCGRCIKYFLWLAAFYQLPHTSFNLFQKLKGKHRMCAPAFFFLKMKATIIMCALRPSSFRKMNITIYMCALSTSTSSKNTTISAHVQVECCGKQKPHAVST